MSDPILASLLLLASATTDCGALLSAQREAALKLDYEAFDQTEGSGFRVLAGAGCPREAADLIEAYLQSSGTKESSVTWHLAQMRAEAGQTPAAIAAARKVIRADEPEDADFKWNDYVHAMIAFLEKDRAAFDRHLARVRGAADRHYGNDLNARLLERIGRHFDMSYAEALAQPEAKGS